MQEEVGRRRNRNWKWNQNISEIISISSITSINKDIFSRSVSPEMYHKQFIWYTKYHFSEIKTSMNKLASFNRSFASQKLRPTQCFTGVKSQCRATNVAKNGGNVHRQTILTQTESRNTMEWPWHWLPWLFYKPPTINSVGITLQVQASFGQRWHLVSGFSFSLGSRLNQGGRLDTAHWDYQISGLTLGPWAWHRSCAIETILLNSWCPHMTLSTVTWSNPIKDSWCSHMVCTKDVICRDLFAWQLHHQRINSQS